MNIITAILILGATGSASRSMQTEVSLPGIVGGLVAGGGKDAWDAISRSRGSGTGLQVRDFEAPALAIDGEIRTGWRSWARAAGRTAAYAYDFRDTGSVEYAYRLRVRGCDVRRKTRIENDRVLLTTDIYWTETVPVTRRITRRVPIYVTIIITGSTDSRGVTTLHGRAVGTADTSAFHCPLVRRIAERKAAETLNGELAAALLKIETTGRGLYAAGELPEIVGRIGAGIRMIGRLRR